MNVNYFLKSILILLIVISGCKQEPDPKPFPEQGYPTIYKPLNPAEFSERNRAFQKINVYKTLHLNEYGFVSGEIPIRENDSITKDFVIDTIDSLINRYQLFMGIPANTNFNYEEQFRINVPYMIPFGSDDIKSFFENLVQFDGQQGWDEMMEGIKFDFFISQISIESIRFLGTDIHFHFKLKENKLVLTNNWYPKAFLPSEEIYTLNDAVPIACKELLKQTGKNFWESKHEFGIVKIFTSIKTDRGIEIRECWRINALINERTYGDIFIDTQTGEIIKYNERNIVM